MLLKTRYIQEINGGGGVVFATGTPIANSVAEMFTMQRYLQTGTLRKQQLQHFDSWAATFGEPVTAMELAPDGAGYRLNTRFARFINVPELNANLLSGCRHPDRRQVEAARAGDADRQADDCPCAGHAGT